MNMLTITAIALLCLGGAVPAGIVFAQQKPAAVLVHEVSSVDITMIKTLPPGVEISAEGKVLTGGFTNPRLEMVIYITPPADGIQELKFIVDPPPKDSIVTQAIVDVKTPTLTINRVPTWMKGVRVTAETNNIVKHF